MKVRALTSLTLTIVLLIIGYLSLDSDAPTRFILLPGVMAEFELAPIVSPTTIGIGGPIGLLVVLVVSGVTWFTPIFLVAIISGRFGSQPKASGVPKKA